MLQPFVQMDYIPVVEDGLALSKHSIQMASEDIFATGNIIVKHRERINFYSCTKNARKNV